MSKPPYRWTSSTVTHVGNVRKVNEDSCLDRGDVGLWVVADGMGGHASGDLASQLIVNTLAKIEPAKKLAEYVDRIEEALLKVNQRLIDMAAQTNQTSGSTVVVLLAFGRHGIIVWAGDSRIYRLRGGEIRQLTTDHSQVEMYVEQGLISREEAALHPAGNMVTRAVGAAADLFLELDIHELQHGDRYLLCSDGLDKHVADPEIAKILGKGDPKTAAQSLIDVTLARGAVDNVTVSVVEILGAGRNTKTNGVEDDTRPATVNE
jgi:serine/threonine protein phosphatase PrpC